MSQSTATGTNQVIRAPRLSGLVASEVLRARSRRSLRWMVLIGVLAILGVSALLFANSAPLSQGDLERSAAQYLAAAEGYYQECLNDDSIPDEHREQACWKPSSEDAAQSALWNLGKQPFLASDLEGLMYFAGGISVLIALMVAASAGGADWGARTMGLLLSWEPRRVRVFLVRLGVVAVFGLVITTVLVGLALGLGSMIAQAHGVVGEVQGLSELGVAEAEAGPAIEIGLRWLPLGVLAAAGGYALAMATRSTGWAIGAAIGFVSIVESVIGLVWPWASQWLIQTNVAAWLTGGMYWVIDRTPGPAPMGESLTGEYVEPGTIWISDIRGLLTLTVGCAALLVVSALLLRSRDVD